MATLTIKKAHHGEFKQVLAALRLATLDNRSFVAIPKKKLVYRSILGVLLRSGFIEGFEERGETIVINLKQTY